MFRPCIILLLLWVSFACSPGADMSPEADDFIVLSDHLSNNQVTCFGEDAFGYVWVGTLRGVNKYNGYEFLQHYHSDDSTSLSNNQVQRIYSDTKGRLWITTRYGINMLSKQGIFTRVPVESPSHNVQHVAETSTGRLFINTVNSICEWDEQENRFRSRIDPDPEAMALSGFYVDKADRLWSVGYGAVTCYDGNTFERLSTYTPEGYVLASCLRANGELWVATNDRLYIIDVKSGHEVPPPPGIGRHPVLSKATVSLIHAYDDASLLICTQKQGMFLINTYNGEIIRQDEPGFPFRVPDTEISTLYTDSHKNLWIGSYDQGFTVVYYHARRFNANEYLRDELAGKSVSSVATDLHGNLWIATRMHGLMVYRADDRLVHGVPASAIFAEESPYRDRVHLVYADSKGMVWLQTNDALLECSYRQRQLRVERRFRNGALFNAVTEDRHGTIRGAGTGENLFSLEEGADAFRSVALYPAGYNFTNGLLTLSGGRLMVASFMHNIRLIDPLTHVQEEIAVQSVLKGMPFIPSCLYEDAQGDVWLGTIGSGLFRYSQHTKELKRMEGIDCREISSVTEDVQGNVWVGTLYGLFKYDRTVERFTGYYEQDGIGGNQFNERVACRLPDNTLVLGGTHGLTVFDPVDVSIRRRIPLYIEALSVHNRRLKPEAGGRIETAMLLNPDVHLRHDENSIELSYAAPEYTEFHQVQYAYQLEGFDTRPIEAHNYRHAFYSNLPSGTYTFRVYARSHDNSIAEVTTAVRIVIDKAPWLTWPALLLYLLAVAGVFLLIAHMYTRILISKKQATIARQEKEHEQHLNRMNVSFFANIAHEFRTPLTLISGPIATLCRDESLSEGNQRLLHTVQRSVRRMLRLVNQILDFNRLENDALRLSVSETDVVELVSKITDMFRPNAREKGYSYYVNVPDEPFVTRLDRDKFEKMMVNLIGNALKFSLDKGTITIRFDVVPYAEAISLAPHGQELAESEYVKITVEDTGVGIAPEELENIFQRYYQLNNNRGEVSWGTGIGLYFSRRLAEMHHGCLFAGNRQHERGSIFTLLLPTHPSVYPMTEREETSIQQEYIIQEAENEMIRQPEEPAARSNGKATLLVVDDDTEIARYLRELLSHDFNVISKYSAEAAWEVIEEVSPDLILSDVIMPGTDGYTFCKRIKENISTCHIPVILLTAKVSIDNQVEGLNVGANAYVTKPFDPAYLTALIGSQLRNREYARRILSDTTQTASISEELISAKDKAFLNDLYTLMEKELSNSELNVSSITETLHISRTKLYYKVKGLTGENPTVFFKTYKLNRAAQLIKEGKYNMSEIADITGFSTPSHFSANFKKKFGVSPSDYKDG